MISNQDELSANKKALLKIRELKQQLAEKEQQTYQPIAVVSMACRFPRRASTPEKFWQQLMSGESFVRDIPESRWDPEAFFDEDPDAPGKMYTQKGVYLDDIDQMDPEFFGISPREATWVDPQQRLLMEVSWEAMERAGWVPEQIGDATGVFVGWMHNDYQNEASDSFLNLNPYIATGAAGSFLCGRLAYYLGLHGPALAVDTACSSSLVALHLGIQSLQRKECDRALVGGVNVICSPTTNILTCKLKALSPQGHSRAFDAAADGYLRGEGCGVVALRRLDDARRSGDRILGIIRGSAVGHNGFSSGLTAPNPKAQEMVIQQALSRAGIQPEQVNYLEAHGTGTELGDPLEVQAASAALCQQRDPDHPLLVGSVKTNIGHLEAAAGMAGLIKVLLSLNHGQIPGQLNFENPNPHIAWESTPIKVLTDATEWPASDQRIAGVSAFGMSGTNAHVLVQSPTSEDLRTATTAVANKMASPGEFSAEDAIQDESPDLLTISAKNEDALYELSESYMERLSGADREELKSICQSSNLVRSHFEHRAAVVANQAGEVIQSLEKLVRGQADDRTVMGQIEKRLRLTWQFTGQGSQYPGMGRQLFESEPVFRDAVMNCERWLSEIRSESLTQVLFEDDEKIHNTYWTQPGLFALQMGLAHLMEHWGIRPDLVLGHSVGQYAAACVAGIMSWEDGLKLISERARLIASLPAGGRMVAVFAKRELVEKLVGDIPGIDVGAYNVTHLVISGEEPGIAQAEAELERQKIRTKSLRTSHAFHSRLMDPILDQFAEFAEQFDFQPSQIPLVCNQTGQVLAADEKLNGRYWADHIRGAVRYHDSLQSVFDSKCQMLVELGPKPVLTGMARALGGQQVPDLIHCLNEPTDDRESLLLAAGALYTKGLTPDFERMGSQSTRRLFDLPTYPFQRRRFWGPDKPRAAHAEHHTAHPLLGSRISLANAQQQLRFENFVDQDSPSWLPDHQVMGSTVMPGAAFVELAAEAVRQTGQALELIDVKFERPLSVDTRTSLQTVVEPSNIDTSEAESKEASHGNFLESYSQADATSPWTRHFVVKSCRPMTNSSADRLDLEQLKTSFDQQVDVEEFYSFLESIDLNYGTRFRTIDSLFQSDEGVLTHLVERADLKGYGISPTLLDGALHSLAIAISRDGDELFLPIAMGQVRIFGEVNEEAWCHAVWVQPEGNLRTANLKLISNAGELLLEIEELQVQRIDRSSIRKATRSGANPLLFDFQWRRSRLAGSSLQDKKLWIVGSSSSAKQRMETLVATLAERGHRCQTVLLGQDEAIANSSGTVNSEADDRRIKLEDGSDFDWGACQNCFSETGGASQPDGVIWLLKENETVGPRSKITETNARNLVSLIQWLRKSGIRNLDSGLQLITEKAIDVEGDSSDPAESTAESWSSDPTQTQYWGLGRVLSAECPEYRCRVIDVEEASGEHSGVDRLADVLLTDNEENQIAIRQSDTFVPRISGIKVQPEKQEWIRSDACYLITGGLGKLGRQAAKWLAEKGAQQVILVSRREPDDETKQFLDQISESGAEAIVHAGDMADPQHVDALFKKFGQEYLPLAGIIHSAGVLDDGMIDNQSWPRFEKVLRPKIDAAWNLHAASLDQELDFFVLYSSVASVLGSPGQANYAMGNGYLDGLAFYRRGIGLPALSVNWGPWTEGMADDEKIKKRLSVQGITALEVQDAHAAMETAMLGKLTQCFVIDVDWRKLKLGADGKTPLILSELVTQTQKGRGGDSQLVAKLKKLAPAAQREMLVTTVQKLFQDVLASDTPPEIDRPLIEMGLDSLMAVEFGTSLAQAFGGQFEIGPSLLFDHPTIESIADYLATLIAGEDSASSNDDGSGNQPSKETGQDRAGDPVESISRDDVAIIGMSCRFPGAENVQQYWQNLLDGKDSVREIPGDRWDIDRFYSADREPGKMYTRQGGFLERIGDFDAAFFNISDTEACWIDPQHRMLLENSYHALEDAGVRTKPLQDSNVGVFMGIMGQDYAFLPSLEDKEVVEGFEGAGLSHSAGVGRISYLLGLEGPSVSVDTASSSSLVAVIQAVRSLQEGNCNVALAGGVNAILAPVNSLLMSKAGLLSPDGRCKSFSEQADGFGRGEGCGVVVLKRLSDAQRDQDRILAVIRGGAIGHNGFSGGLTTPSSKAQVRVLQSAVRDAKVAPGDIQYLEAHGTGTEFGDPIELSAAAQVYGKGRSKDQPLIVGSAKANIGHLEAAGGVSGLIKVVLSLQHGLTPKQIHFDSPSKHIPWQRMPVKVLTEEIKWEDEPLQLTAVTALGLAGTNAHLIVSAAPTSGEESLEVDESAAPSVANIRQHLLFVSAKTDSSLTELLKRYHRMLEDRTLADSASAWSDICYSSGVGRRHFDVRECVCAQSTDEAKLALEHLIAVRVELSSRNGVHSQNGSHTRNGSIASNGVATNNGSAAKANASELTAAKKLIFYTGADLFSWESLDELTQLSDAVPSLLREYQVRLNEFTGGETSLQDFLKGWSSNPADTDLFRYIVYTCLSEIWKSWGIEPDVVAGGGVGQLAAACLADVLAPVDGFSIMLERGSGEETDWDAFEERVDRINFYPPNLSLICAQSGEAVPIHKTLGGSYWRAFFQSLPGYESLLNHPEIADCNLVIQGGSPESWSMIQSRLDNEPAVVLHCQDDDGHYQTTMMNNVAALYRAGINPRFESINKSEHQKRVALPIYPFQKKRFWITEISRHLPEQEPEEEVTETNV